jgi:hypothetical protein
MELCRTSSPNRSKCTRYELPNLRKGLLVAFQTKFLVVSDAEKSRGSPSYKCRMAGKYGVPVVSLKFLEECCKAEKLLDPDPFVVIGKTASQEFSSGKIVGLSNVRNNYWYICC